jgi:glycosyltransferase involved in cell wall biosynthesis
MSTRFRLAVVATHPIQYQGPLWRKLAASDRLDPTVFFLSRHGVESRLDPNFATEFVWDVPLVEGYRHEFVDSFSLPGVSARRRTRWGPTGARLTTGLTKRFGAAAFDAVMVQGYASGAAWAGAWGAWRTGTPLIVRGESHDRGRQCSLWQAMRRQLVSRWMAHVDAVVAIGQLNRTMWRGLGVPDERILLSTYAIENDRFRRTIDGDPLRAAALRREWGVGIQDPVFLFAGKLINVKAPALLLSAFSSLPESSGAHLVFVGSGPLESELRALQDAGRIRRVHWAGFVNQGDIPHYYSAADVLVLPSLVEPWGLVVNEALASGTPCIVSDLVGSGPDLVEGFDAGLVFAAGDVSELRRCLQEALDSECRLKWKLRLDEFSRSVTLDRTSEVIADAVAMVTRARL